MILGWNNVVINSEGVWGAGLSLQVMWSLYDEIMSCVHIFGTKSSTFPVSVGLSQGCPLVSGQVYDIDEQDVEEQPP